MKFQFFFFLLFLFVRCTVVVKPPQLLLDTAKRHKKVAILPIQYAASDYKDQKITQDTTLQYVPFGKKAFEYFLVQYDSQLTTSYVCLTADSLLKNVQVDAYLVTKVHIHKHFNNPATEFVIEVATSILFNRSRPVTNYPFSGTMTVELYDKQNILLQKYFFGYRDNSGEEIIFRSMEQLFKQLPYQKRFHKP